MKIMQNFKVPQKIVEYITQWNHYKAYIENYNTFDFIKYDPTYFQQQDYSNIEEEQKQC